MESVEKGIYGVKGSSIDTQKLCVYTLLPKKGGLNLQNAH